MTEFVLSSDSRTTAGILLIAIVAVEYGGTYMLRIVRGREPVTGFQRDFARAGHAHAGVLVILALVAQVLADAGKVTGLASFGAHTAIPIAAILMPLGFFLSSAGRGTTAPNRLIVLLYAGVAMLAVGAVSFGIGLLAS
jgi:hypothetical protein